MHAEPQADADEELAHQAQAGSLSSFEQLVYRYEARLFRFVANSCRNESDAQEVTQEAFVSAYLKIRQFDVSRSFATWLFTIARRKCIDRHRASRPATEERPEALVEEEDPSTLLARREAGEDIWRLARRTLSQLQFQALWLRYAEDMRVEEIARILRKTQTHVKVLLFRGRTLLGRELENRRMREKSVSRLAAFGTNRPPIKETQIAPARLATISNK